MAGGFAGCAELLCLYPLDTLKTRLQISSDARNSGAPRQSLFGMMKGIVGSEGTGALYRGLGSALAIEPIKRGLKFSANEYFVSHLLGGSSNKTPTTAAVCGSLAGAVEVRIHEKNPLHVVTDLRLDRETSSIELACVLLSAAKFGALFDHVRHFSICFRCGALGCFQRPRTRGRSH